MFLAQCFAFEGCVNLNLMYIIFDVYIELFGCYVCMPNIIIMCFDYGAHDSALLGGCLYWSFNGDGLCFLI